MVISWVDMTGVVHSWVYYLVAAAFLLLVGIMSSSGKRFGVAGVFAKASSALHLAKVQTVVLCVQAIVAMLYCYA